MDYTFDINAFPDKAFNSYRLTTELRTLLPNTRVLVRSVRDLNVQKLVVTTERKLTEAEVASITPVLAAHQSDATHLPTKKAQKIASIDNKTKVLIGRGFIYNGIRFSLSDNMQKNLLGAMLSRENPAIFPISFNSLDDASDVTVANASELEAMYSAAMLAIRAAWDAGTALKARVRDAETVTAVSAISDNR